MRHATAILFLILFPLEFIPPSPPIWDAKAGPPFTSIGIRFLYAEESFALPAEPALQIESQQPARETNVEQIEKRTAVPADIDDEDMFDSMKPVTGRQNIFRPSLFSRLPVNAAQSGSALTLHEMRKEIGDLSPPTVGLTKSPPTLTPNSQTTTAHVFNTKILPSSTTDISIHPASQSRPTIVVYKASRTLVMPLGSFIEGAR
jgi:hypothetical protein